MSEQISRLMDGEIDASELDSVCAMLKSEAAMATWGCYHTIGDALRGETAVTRSVGTAVARHLAQEPTVVAPRTRPVSGVASWAWAVAASVAAVTVVGWTAYTMIDATPAGLAKAREAGTVRAAQMRPATVPADYLIAHQEYAPANALQGVGPYLRDVAASNPARPAVAQ
ncbi:MAG TPA: sigma-E factor negative regulatory protein [Casimicrobiaceae bacterium]